MSPWLDLRVPPKGVKLAAVEVQRHRRFLKTHLPVDALVFSPKAKYIYIGRDGRDVVWSEHNHFANGSELLYQLLNDTSGRVGPPIDRPPASIRQYFLEWLEGDGYPLWSFWESIGSWWAIRDLPDVMLLHFAELKADLPGQIRRIANSLDVAIDEQSWGAIVEHCSFKYMRRHGDKIVPLGGLPWIDGARTFIHKGTNGRWRDTLTAEDCARYERMAVERLGEGCAHWLTTGERVDRSYEPNKSN